MRISPFTSLPVPRRKLLPLDPAAGLVNRRHDLNRVRAVNGSGGVGVAGVLEVRGGAVSLLALLEIHDSALGVGQLGNSKEMVHGLTVNEKKVSRVLRAGRNRGSSTQRQALGLFGEEGEGQLRRFR